MANRRPAPTCFSVKEVAKRISISEKSVRRWVTAGDLHHHKLGASIRVSEEDLTSFLAAHRRRGL
jgi:excisionase family DNA binding protein